MMKTKTDEEQLVALQRLMVYYIMHLRIPVYSGQYYYYYDVLEALARDVFVNHMKEERLVLIDFFNLQEIWS
jgi:hypothetical protein